MLDCEYKVQEEMEHEKVLLDNIAKKSIYGKGVGGITTKYCGNIFKKYMKRGSVLELGPADGVMTEELFNQWKEDYTVVDAGHEFISKLALKYKGIQCQECFFEDFVPERKFDNIILGHVLEHVQNPMHILQLCKSWLAPGGILLAAVPNADSLHRQAAVEMKLLKSVDSFSEKDKRHGHKRIYNYNSFLQLFKNAEYNIIQKGGYWLKPLSDRQIEESWSGELIDAYLKLGEKYPEFAGEIFVIARG